MRAIESPTKQVRRLRSKHTEQFQQCKWVEMQTTRRKTIEALNATAALVEKGAKWPSDC